MDSLDAIPLKLEGESDIEYARRILEIERQKSFKRFKILSDENNKLKDDKKKLKDDKKKLKDDKKKLEEEIKKQKQFSQIILVMDKNPVNCIPLKIENNFYNNIKIESFIIEKIASKVSAFSKIEVTNEKSGSISNDKSVHCLWKEIINIIQYESSFEKVYRVVYEWGINHPLAKQVLEIDFTIIPVNNSYLNWFNYMGGFELKKSPPLS